MDGVLCGENRIFPAEGRRRWRIVLACGYILLDTNYTKTYISRMNTKEMVRFLDFLTRNGVWLFSFQDAQTYFEESDAALQASLKRHIANELICRVTRNLYANPRSPIKSSSAVGELVAALRPGRINYLSLEEMLSENGSISQVCQVHTIMTSGRKGEFNTRFARIEFEHYSGPAPLENLAWNEDRKLWLASPYQAWEDFKKKRPESLWHIVDMEDLEDAQHDYEKQIAVVEERKNARY